MSDVAAATIEHVTDPLLLVPRDAGRQATTGVLELTPTEYHADRTALSASGVRKLLMSPATFRHWLDNPSPPTRTFDLGHAAHRVVLGAGADLEIIDADSYLSKVAKQAKVDAHAAGKIPVLAHEWAQVRAMHAALLAHPLAARLLYGGSAEVALRWVDEPTGVTCRALVDYLRPPLIVDYKTTESAGREDLARAAARYGYHIQSWWYLDGARTLGLAELPAFAFVAQEKIPPYLVQVFDLDDEFLELGAAAGRRAREMFRDCTQSGLWPGYPTRVATLAAPRWLRTHTDEEYQ